LLMEGHGSLNGQCTRTTPPTAKSDNLTARQIRAAQLEVRPPTVPRHEAPRGPARTVAESSEPEISDGAPDPAFGNATTTPKMHHPVSERCRNHAKGYCDATSCTRWHGKSNPQAAACRDHETPGIWCERAYEVSGPGCPFSHKVLNDDTSHSQARRRPRNPPPENPRPPKTCWYYVQAGEQQKSQVEFEHFQRLTLQHMLYPHATHGLTRLQAARQYCMEVT